LNKHTSISSLYKQPIVLFSCLSYAVKLSILDNYSKVNSDNTLQQIYGNLITEDTVGTKNPWIWSTIKTMFYVKNSKYSLVIVGSNNYDYNLLRRLVFLYWVSKNHNDTPFSWQLSFNTPASHIMEGIIDLHHDIMFFVILTSIFVS